MTKETQSYEDAVKDRAALDDNDPGPEKEVNVNVDTDSISDKFDDVETILAGIPDFLKDSEGIRDIAPPGGRRGGINIDLSNLDELDQAGLLEVMTRVNIAQLSALFDIADAVEPVDSIVVSGTNVVDEAGIAVPVVPQSDNQDIPSRKLMIRASRKNKLPIYFGDDDVRPSSGFVLEAGESITLDIDLRNEQLYMAAEKTGPQVQLLGVL